MKTNIEEEVEDVENYIDARKKLDLNGAAHGGEEGAIHRNRWKTRRRRCPHHHRPTHRPRVGNKHRKVTSENDLEKMAASFEENRPAQ
jgi:hypothetical protein